MANEHVARLRARADEHRANGSYLIDALMDEQAAAHIEALTGALTECQKLLAYIAGRDGSPNPVAGVETMTAFARCVAAEARARAALSGTTPAPDAQGSGESGNG